jgi:L-alanine-DL-glutamate epimerase-like enolase superfamily enzyme
MSADAPPAKSRTHVGVPDEQRVDRVDAMLLRVPLSDPVAGSSARGGVTPAPLAGWDLIVVSVRTRAGVTGLGFAYALRAGGEAILEAVRRDLAPLVLGEDGFAGERLWHRLYWATYNAGRRGVMIHALSALDTALWDLRARTLGVSLARLLGADRDRVPAYESSSGWLSLPLEQLVHSCAAAIECGFTAVKVMVGADERNEDERRVAAVRRAIGDGPLLLVDAGQKWDLRTAIERTRALEQHGVHFVEEPLACDDARGHELLARAVTTRIATGQSLSTRHELVPLLDRRAVDVVQIDAARVGGITEWLRCAHLAEAAGAELAPHFLEELHVSLVAASPVGRWVEHTPWLSALLDDPPALIGGALCVPEGPGHSLQLRADVERFRIA